MPDEAGYLSDEEIDAMMSRWEEAPSAATFPLEETQRIKADENTLGWIETEFGEVYLGRNLQFFSPTRPSYADVMNIVFGSPPLQYSPAFGSPAWYYLQNAARWAKKSPYFVKPEPRDPLDNSIESMRVY